MPGIFQYERKYGVAADLYFSLENPSGTDSNLFYSNAASLGAGEAQISIDGGAFAATTGVATRVGGAGTKLYKQHLTIAELTGTDISIVIVSATTAYRDALLLVQTKLRLGQMDVDATAIGGNTDALKLTGVGTGLGLNASGGATANGDIGGTRGSIPGTLIRTFTTPSNFSLSTINFDTGATTTVDYYKGCIITIVGGTGAGQSRVITAYSAGRIATLNRNLATITDATSICIITPGEDVWNIPLPELTGIPTPTDTSGNKVQFLFQRFAFKRTQTPTAQNIYTSAGVVIGSGAAVSDDGTTESIGKLT